MYKKGTKLIASMLVFIMMLTYLNVIGEVFAVSLETQNTQTNNANVEFDSYFVVNKNKTHSTTQNIGEENYLYASIKVKEAGYLKNATISVENANFKLLDTMQNNNVSKVEENKITLNQIKNGNTQEIAIPIQILESSMLDVVQLNKENSIKLTGIYVDGNGKEKQIEKEIIVKLAWTGEKQAELNMQIAKFIPYNINNQKGLILQTIVQSYLQDNILPVNENKIEISVPTINNIKPVEVKVVANTTKATNGDETGINFTQENYFYDAETNKLTITVENKENEEGKISWQKESKDEFVITHIYPETTIPEEGAKILISANSELTVLEANKTKVQKSVEGEVTLKEPINNLVDFTIEATQELSKGQIYANEQASKKVETEYQETWTANVGIAELTDKIILEGQADNFITEQNAKQTAVNATYYKTVAIEKENFDKMLGEEGSINLYTGTTLIAKIDKQTEVNKQGKLEINLAELGVNSLTIETSKVQAEGKINLAITKAIKGEIDYSKPQLKEINQLEVSLIGKAVNGEINFAQQNATKAIAFVEPTMQAELTINNSNLSTVVTNENVKITAILKTDSLNCMLYQDPILQITLPSYIETINIKNIEVLFETEGTKLNLKNHQIITNNDGTKTIVITLEGTQTEYTLGAISKGVNVIITSDITVSKFTPNKQDQIVMTYTNKNEITRAKTIEQGNVATPINIVAPVGVYTTSTIRNYKENEPALTSISGEEKVATIETMAQARNATFEMTVINNYNNTIDNISILGRLPSKGNKAIIEGTDLGSTMDMTLASAITANGVDTNKVAIYYSENGEATKELNLPANAWTLSPANLANVKSYLIVFADHTMNVGDRISFTYQATIPADRQHNESAYENYVAYFTNNLETGAIQDKVASTKIGVTTGKGPVIETSLSTNTSKTEEVLSGNIIKYKVTVKNTGTETAQDVIATIDLPNGLQYVELKEGSYELKQSQGEVAISLGNIEAGKTVEKEVTLKVGILSALEDTKQVEVKAIITASNISGKIETEAVENTLARTHFIITPTILKEIEVLRENDTYTYYMEILSSGLSEIREETIVTITLPEEIEYQSVEIKDKVKNTKTDITSSTPYNYDAKTRVLTIPLGDIDGQNPKIISLNVKVGNLPKDVYDKQVNIEAKVSAKDARTQYANIETVNIGKVGFKITQSSNIPEKTHITAGEDLTYIFTIENLSSVDLYDVKITDMLPEEFILNHMTVKKASGTTKNSYKNSINVNLKGREIITLEVNVSANMLDETKTVSNKAKIEYEGIDSVESSSYIHIIDKFDEASLEDPNNPSNPSNQTKRIMGTVWIDENTNGARDEEETKVANVEMLLFNNQTGKMVTDSTGNIVRTTTDENGTYTFAGINQGRYTVIFLYDTANYSATSYRKQGVEETINSDAVDSKITLDGVTRVAAITEEVVVTNGNIYNIDLGLIASPKFDLKLDKTVSKITVQDESGTTTYEYGDSKLAKKDLVGKQINNTTIIVEYKIKVTNEGALAGYVKKIADYMPSEMKFNSELNRDWYTSENGTLYNASLANTLIKPGESKEVTLTLTKKMTENNLGLYHNEAEIYESYNDLGIEDIDSVAGNKVSNEDDISSADVLISVKTGETIVVVGLSLIIIATIAIGAYFIKKKVLR